MKKSRKEGRETAYVGMAIPPRPNKFFHSPPYKFEMIEMDRIKLSKRLEKQVRQMLIEEIEILESDIKNNTNLTSESDTRAQIHQTKMIGQKFRIYL